MLDVFNKEELKELKRAINSIIAIRATYHTTDKKDKEDNARLLQIDYKLLNVILQLLENIK